MYVIEKMLTGCCFAFLSLTLSFAQEGGWQLQESGTDAHLMDVFFINADTGWVAGHGIIMNTTDGGENWTLQDSSDMEFWSIWFTDKDHGWAVGYKKSGLHGFIYHTEDGGQNWSFNDSSQYELNDVFFVNEDTGYAVGGGRSHITIYGTTNAGGDWEKTDEYGQQLFTVHFVNDTVGWASGAQGYILKTEDGGDSWNATYLDIGISQLLDCYFINQDTGWVVGGDSIFKTTNGGDSWESLEGLSNHSYYCCYFINSNAGWVGARGNQMPKLIYTADGGNSWQVQDSMAGFSVIYSLFFIDKKTGWGVGTGGLMLKTSSGGIVSVEDVRQKQNVLPGQFGLHQNYPNPFSSSTTISYDLPVSGYVRLVVYNLRGEEVIRLVDRKQSAGRHDLIFDASGLAGGIYHSELTAAGKVSVKKMSIVR
jgi:photosystem II stability/assembly factor-like uncharacterized protein